MIKFFRKIRYDLMEKNNTGKYLQYAIGEIVLVVIGILIALQINTWNSDRIAQKNAVLLTKRLLTETNNNIDELVYFIAKVDISKNCALKLLKSTGADYKKYDEYVIDSLLLGTYRVFNYEFNTAVLDKVLVSGELSNVVDDKVETALYRIKTLQKGYQLSEVLLEQHLNDNVSSFWRDKISMRQIDYNFSENGQLIGQSQLERIDNRAILANRAFENIIDDTFYILQSLQNKYLELNTNLTELSHLLTQKTEATND